MRLAVTPNTPTQGRATHIHPTLMRTRAQFTTVTGRTGAIPTMGTDTDVIGPIMGTGMGAIDLTTGTVMGGTAGTAGTGTGGVTPTILITLTILIMAMALLCTSLEG